MHFDPWTLGLQAANFLVLVWLLHRFLYRPVLAIIAARKAAADKLVSDVQAEKKAAEDLRRSLESQRAAIAQERETALQGGPGAPRMPRERRFSPRLAAMPKRSRRKPGRHSSVTEPQIVQDGGARLRRGWRSRSSGACSGRAPAAAVQERMLDLVCDDVGRCPPNSRKQIAERVAADGTTLEMVTAAPLEHAKRPRGSAKSLSSALGAPAKPTFRVDNALIAGVEIHFPFTILRRSWSEDLKRIEAELNDDDHAAQVA